MGISSFLFVVENDCLVAKVRLIGNEPHFRANFEGERRNGITNIKYSNREKGRGERKGKELSLSWPLLEEQPKKRGGRKQKLFFGFLYAIFQLFLSFFYPFPAVFAGFSWLLTQVFGIDPHITGTLFEISVHLVLQIKQGWIVAVDTGVRHIRQVRLNTDNEMQ